MKTNVCKIALMFLIGTALSLLFNSCSKDPVIPENETDNKLHEDPSKMTIRLVECHCMQTGMKYRKSVDLTRIRNLRPST